jgi:hypothetical protein
MVTGCKLTPVSTTPIVNLPPVSMALVTKMETISDYFNFKFIAEEVDTGDYTLHSYIFANFRKNSKWLLKSIQGHGGN